MTFTAGSFARTANGTMMPFASVLLLVAGWLWCAMTIAAEPTKPLTPVAAREQVGKQVTVRMQVATAKDRLEKRGEIYLDSQEDFRDEKNFAVVITRAGAKSLHDSNVKDIAEYFRNAWIEVAGTVTEVDDIPRIEINSADNIKRLPNNEAKEPTP